MNGLALALCSSSERYLEIDTAGPQLREGSQSLRRCPNGRRATSAIQLQQRSPARPQALSVKLQSLPTCRVFASAIVSVAVRLVPLGQTAGLQVLKTLMPVIAETANRAASASLDDLGSCTLGAEIAAMRHEGLEPRVFRT